LFGIQAADLVVYAGAAATLAAVAVATQYKSRRQPDNDSRGHYAAGIQQHHPHHPGRQRAQRHSDADLPGAPRHALAGWKQQERGFDAKGNCVYYGCKLITESQSD